MQSKQHIVINYTSTRLYADGYRGQSSTTPRWQKPNGGDVEDGPAGFSFPGANLAGVGWNLSRTPNWQNYGMVFVYLKELYIYTHIYIHKKYRNLIKKNTETLTQKTQTLSS